MNPMVKRIAALAVVAALGYFGLLKEQTPWSNDTVPRDSTVDVAQDGLAAAFENRRSDIQVKGEGRVTRLLPDDNEGSRHQKFILRLASGQSVLIAHNIDLAPRIPDLRKGDTVAFFGEYEWNARGGVIHWTHHDPAGRHVGGWLKHSGRIYE